MVLEEYKNVGETTSSFSKRLSQKYGEKVAICGKLDPLAHGSVIILLGNETKLMNKYLSHDKCYRFLIGFSFSTDTDDLMGMPLAMSTTTPSSNIDIDKEIYKYCLLRTQPFHHFSAINIIKNGIRKPLHYWYRKGELQNEDIPVKEVTVYNILKCENVVIEDILEYTRDKLSTIGEKDKEIFRVPEILDNLSRSLSGHSQSKIQRSLECNQYIIHVSSGFYIRMIAKYLRETFSINACIIDIERLSN